MTWGHMALKDLTKLVAPPKSPLFAGGTDSWSVIQERLGVRLPATLGEFARTYGSGEFDGGTSVRIYNPYDPAYERKVRFVSEIYLGLRDESPDYYPYEFYPEAGGLFPIGDSGGGQKFFLSLANGGSMGGDLVVYDDRCEGLVEYRMDMMDFFYEFLSNGISDYFPQEVKFFPALL